MHYKKLNLQWSPFLSEMVHAVYTIASPNEPLKYQAIPNGYIGLTIILQGHSYTEHSTGVRGNAWVVGMITKPLTVYQSEKSREVTIVFNPVKLRSFIREPMRVFAHGLLVPAHDVFPKSHLNQLIETLAENQNEVVMLRSIEQFLKKLFIEENHHSASLFMYSAIQDLQVLEVADLANCMGVSTTTLRNWSNDFIGLSPKELIQIMRFQKVLSEKEVSNLTDLAYRFQYFDQAHFAHSFKQLSGMSPKQYFSDQHRPFDFYKYGRWLENTFDEK